MRVHLVRLGKGTKIPFPVSAPVAWKTRAMKLLALIESPDHVCFRYRIAPFLPALQEQGWNCLVEPLARRTPARVAQLRRARQYDLVILQRKLLPLWQLVLLRRWARRLIYDVDDALYVRDSFHPRGSESWSRPLRFWATVRAADAVICGNRHLRSRVLELVPEQRVLLVPTCVDPGRYTPAQHHRRQGVRLVWIGQRSTLGTLETMRATLGQVARRVLGLELWVICDHFPQWPELTVVPRRWSSQSEAADLAQADIGISWLPQDEWSRGKCGLKVLQYMAAGLPVVANPVGVHCEMIRQGCNGFLAKTSQQWCQALELLARVPQLRQALGEQGRKEVERYWSLSRWHGVWGEFINAVTPQAQAPPFPGASPAPTWIPQKLRIGHPPACWPQTR